MARIRPYYAEGALSTAFYDAVTAADGNLGDDIEAYAKLAPPGGSVLELGAGSGRITVALAERGLHVTGIDISPAMLAKAEARRGAAPTAVAERIVLRRADMTAIDLKRTFDLALAPYFTLAHVPAGAAWRNVFTVMARHLEPGALCAVHLPLAERMVEPPPAPTAVALDLALPGGGRLQLHVLERRFRADIGRFDQVVDYVERDPGGRILRRSAERLTYYVADPRPFAAAAGLASEGAPQRLAAAGNLWLFRRV
jgi:SAM-dependent methyltransferase